MFLLLKYQFELFNIQRSSDNILSYKKRFWKQFIMFNMNMRTFLNKSETYELWIIRRYGTW